jgi:hypothetical protein
MPDELKVINIIREIEHKFENDESKYLVFRGLPNISWQIGSSAARRLKNNKRSDKADFIKYHQVLLDDVKKGNYKGLKDEDLRGMCDLEILAQIQHLGGATCLTDFSTNLLIALWFATEPHKENNEETDAKLYAINLKSLECLYMFQDVMNIEHNNKSYQNSIEDLLTYKCSTEAKKEHFWYWKPRIMNGRINNQNSIFIFGLPAFPEALYKVVGISHNDKSQIRQELREYFGIDVNTVYPDLMGFSVNANNHTAMFNDFFSMNCMDIAFSYLHEKKYKNCERYINDMKNCPARQPQHEKKQEETKCERRGTDKCNINKADIEYLDGKCIYSQTEYEYMESIDNKKVINNDRLVNTYIEIIRKLCSAISNKTQFAFDCMCTLFSCYYNIELCDPHYLEKDNLEIFDTLLTTKEIYLNNTLKGNKSVFTDKSEDLIIEFSILELSIFSYNDKIYKDQIYKIKNMYKAENIYVNGCLLLEFFKYIGKYVFDNSKRSEKLTQKDITYKISSLKEMIEVNSKTNKNIFSFSVNWNFEDMRKMIVPYAVTCKYFAMR